MKNFVIVLIYAFTTHLGYTQSVNTLMGARQAGLGYASATLTDDWSIHNNPAGISSLKQRSVGFAYDLTPGIAGGNRVAASLNTPTKWFNSGVGFFRFGDALYSESRISIAVGNKIGISSLSLRGNYNQYRADGFGTSTAFSLDIGSITQLTQQISVGLYITNITQASFTSSSGERLPTRLVAGFGYTPSEKILITTEIEKDLDFPIMWRTGFEMGIYKSVFFRTGYNLNPNAGFFGFGIKKKNLKIDYALRYQNLLGVSHQASASYTLPEVKKK